MLLFLKNFECVFTWMSLNLECVSIDFVVNYFSHMIFFLPDFVTLEFVVDLFFNSLNDFVKRFFLEGQAFILYNLDYGFTVIFSQLI